jgi:hypothetical protein
MNVDCREINGPLPARKVKFKVFLSFGFRNKQMESLAKQASSRHLMAKPSPQDFLCT